MLPVAQIVHHVAGRTRLRVPEREGDVSWLEGLAQALEALPEVEAVIATPVTGSVLVYHRGAVEELAVQAAARELFELAAAPGPLAPLSRRLDRGLGERLGRMDRWLRRTSGGSVDLGGVTFLGLLLASGWQFLSGRGLPAGVTLLNYAVKLSPGEEGHEGDDGDDGDGDGDGD